MIVLEASAILELLLGTASGRVIALRIADPALGLHVRDDRPPADGRVK